MIGIKQRYHDLFFQTEQTVNRKKSGFRAARIRSMFRVLGMYNFDSRLKNTVHIHKYSKVAWVLTV